MPRSLSDKSTPTVPSFSVPSGKVMEKPFEDVFTITIS